MKYTDYMKSAAPMAMTAMPTPRMGGQKYAPKAPRMQPPNSRIDEWRQSPEYMNWNKIGLQQIGFASDGTVFGTITEARMYDNWLKSQGANLIPQGRGLPVVRPNFPTPPPGTRPGRVMF